MRRWRVPGAGMAVALLLVVVFLVGFYQPRRDKVVGMVADTGQLRTQQVVLRRSIAALEVAAKRRPELDAGLQLLEQLVPVGLAEPAALAEVQRVSDEAGVKLVSVTFGDPEQPKDAPKSQVAGTVVVEGPFLRITDLLRRVEVDIHRAVLVDNVALTEADAGFPQLTGTWSGHAFALLPADDSLLTQPNTQSSQSVQSAGSTSATTAPPVQSKKGTP